ncbi:hypothetical protein Tco_1273382 [Tanacetum coccineum]
MYTFSPMMVANSRKHHCRVRPYTREVLVLSTNLESQTKHYPLVFRNRRGDEARIKKTWYNQAKTWGQERILEAKVYYAWIAREVPKAAPLAYCCVLLDRKGNDIQANTDADDVRSSNSIGKVGSTYRI